VFNAKDKELDLLRLCFAKDADRLGVAEEHKQRVSEWESMIEQELTKQKTWIQGHDINHRAILHRMSRSAPAVDREAYNLLTFYMAERAFAATEILSRGREDKIVCIFYYSNYDSSKVPPTDVIQNSIQTLQKFYPERALKIFVLDPPLWLRLLYAIISPFLSKDTREKVSVSKLCSIFTNLL